MDPYFVFNIYFAATRAYAAQTCATGICRCGERGPGARDDCGPPLLCAAARAGTVSCLCSKRCPQLDFGFGWRVSCERNQPSVTPLDLAHRPLIKVAKVNETCVLSGGIPCRI